MASKSKQPEIKQTPDITIGEARRFFCDRAFILNNDEHFVLALQTGTVVDAQYAFTPKHAKRLLMLLKDKLAAYEKEYGELKTDLPKSNGR